MKSVSSIDSIRLRGVRQNNLKGFDLDLPLGKYIVVTGLSGAGKSSLVFDTLHAEGQRRYVETFSAYTRQFLDLLDKPKVDSIENIRPSIAIEQTNTVKNSRSTVGTMTELTDFFKVWFSHVAACFDPETGEQVEDDTPQSIWKKTISAHSGKAIVLGFRVNKPANLTWPEILTNLKGQSYVRILSGTTKRDAFRIDDLLADETKLADALAGQSFLFVAQDRLTLDANARGRFLEATEAALHFGQGQMHVFNAADLNELGHFSRGLHSPKTGRTFRPATPSLFSFNSPLGACPKCRGFGRVIDIDYRLAVPDHSLSIDQGALKCWEGEVYSESKKDLMVFAKRRKIPTNIPFAALSPEHKDFIVEGEPGYGEENGKTWPQYWYGIKGFFRWLESKTYKMHVRVFLSRYRTYNICPECGGQRLQPESLCWKWKGRTLPDLYQIPVNDLLELLAPKNKSTPATSDSESSGRHQRDLAFDAITTRLRYLAQVGLGYLTLDRTSKTLSGGEVQRVNLTSCLGTSLVDTLFVLDEPSVGLHPRDIDRLIGIIRSLTDIGNTVVVVEHDEAMIRAADHVVEVGPVPGSQGGHIVFEGTVANLERSEESITGAYFSGRQRIELPEKRRWVETPSTLVRPIGARTDRAPSKKVSAEATAALTRFESEPPTKWLTFTNATKHNLQKASVRIPLQRLVCLSGVSGSGKSTLLDSVVYQGLLTHRNLITEDVAEIERIHTDIDFSEIVLVDQSPLSRTPRSNPALYTDAWEQIRELYAATPVAQHGGYSASSFSFNSGDGRCDHCQGLGYERVEMQFLSDVFVPCAVCDGRRFKPEVLAITWNGRSVADLLATSISDALPLFAEHPGIQTRLASLESVGLGYLTLGQPLNTLSGGESQRLKLVRYLSGYTGDADQAPKMKAGAATAVVPHSALLLLDEPTTGLHRHDVKRLLAVLHALVDRGHSVVVIEHNLDVLKSADWILEVGPEAGAGGGRIVAEGTPETIASEKTATSPFLRAALAETYEPRGYDAELLVAEAAQLVPFPRRGAGMLQVIGARENNLVNLTVSIPLQKLTVVTGVSGSGKSTLAFDIVFAEGQRRFMESMSPYARQFVEQLPRPAIDQLTGIPPTVAIEQRVTRGSRKSTVATITEVAQYLRLLYARMGVQYHPDTDRPVTPLSVGALKKLLARVLETPTAKRAKHLYLCAPLIRGRKGHHQPIASWIQKQGYDLMRADGRILRVDTFEKLDRYKEHDVEVVVADLKSAEENRSPAVEVAARKTGKAGGNSRAVATPAKIVAKPVSALETALRLGKGSCFLLTPTGEVLSWFSTTRTDIETGESFPELDPKQFSFNSPRGWCPACRGHGRIFPWMLEPVEDEKDEQENYLRESGLVDPDADLSENGQICPECHGERLNRIARAVKLPLRGNKPSLSLPALLRETPSVLLGNLRNLELDQRGELITQDIVPQIEERLRFLDHVGLGYLSLDRPTETLSGGEAQRIRLAAQLGSNLSGVLYVLDEPSIGLHARDNDRLIETLQALREKGNTLLVVEHDDELMERADHIIDLGPGAGIHGGRLLASGTPAEIKQNAASLTGLFLAKGIAHPLRGAYREIAGSTVKSSTTTKRQPPGEWLELTGARIRNLKNIDLRLPLGRLVMVAGPSGAGKSTLFRDLLHPAVEYAIENRKAKVLGKEFVKKGKFSTEDARVGSSASAEPFDELRGANNFKSVIEVDQAPIGKTPRSTPATYLGIFDLIRQFFASLPEAKMRGYTASRFSFNTSGGRCEVCQGAGRIKLEMAFMPNTYLPCDNCHGSRYGNEVVDIVWKGKNIGQVLQLTFEEAATFFDFHSQLSQICQLMVNCGLGYITLGQSSPTLSGGEAQRLKLVTELSRGLASYKERSRGVQVRNLYLLEEPTIGLHLSDCEKLIHVLHSLVEQGHSVVVIEHHLDLLAEADYIVELGPEGGPGGGEMIYQGPLAGLLKVKRSPTAPYLAAKLKGRG